MFKEVLLDKAQAGIEERADVVATATVALYSSIREKLANKKEEDSDAEAAALKKYLADRER